MKNETRGIGCEKSRAFWCGLVLVFFLALLPRLDYSVSRPLQWYQRSVRFWEALFEGDLRGTFQQHHPGVTTMWVAGLGMQVYGAAHDLTGNELLDPPLTPSGRARYDPVEAGVAALGVALSLNICLIYVLLVRLLGWHAGIAGGCLLALDPFYLTGSKVLHVDAMLGTLMLVSALLLIGHLYEQGRRQLLLSALFAGLAILTKSTAALLAFYAALTVTCRHLASGRDGGSRGTRTWPGLLKGITCDLGTWGLVAGGVFVALWPAMWVMPGEALYKIAEGTLFHVETAHYNPSFLFGEVVPGNPGPLLYLVVVAWKTTLVTLPSLLVAGFFLLRRARRKRERAVWWVLVYAGAFTGLMLLATRKEMRYMLPTLLALDVLAAWGLVQAANAIARWKRLKRRAWLPAALLTSALLIQALAVLRHHPYYDTHHNLLLGGSRVARRVMPVGDQGDGLDLAARYLNGYPGAERMVAGLQRRSGELFQRYFIGLTRPIQEPDVDYWVFAVNPVQRDNRVNLWGEIWEACQDTEPLWTVSFDGVPYVWIYPAYPHDPQAFAIAQRLDVELGEHVRLLGYGLSPNRLVAGEALTLTLFWQSDGRLTADYHVFVHVLNAQGQLVGQSDGVPVQGERPTWSWRDKEIIRDEYVLVTDPGLPNGAYTLSAGMYELTTGERLAAFGPSGERLPDDRILIQDWQIGE